ncbi:hypothetical protein EB235_23420 [Mesorhizobium loti R88b]|uniref:Uncharacterized protein n=1 Tax=Mesorhizobium loti R88b TaxID=935548 RepID=A0A6M7WYA5_RHILI|nr:hypothetical protein EB235_23420 [Mesorhizobium loti R88b]
MGNHQPIWKFIGAAELSFDQTDQSADVDNTTNTGKLVNLSPTLALEAVFNQPVCDIQNDLVGRVSVIHQKPIYNLLPAIAVCRTVKGTKPHVADGTTRDQFALTKPLPDCLLGNQSAVREPVKDIYWRLMIRFAVIRHPAIDATVTLDGFIYSLKTHFGFTSVVLLLYPTHGIFRNSLPAPAPARHSPGIQIDLIVAKL